MLNTQRQICQKSQICQNDKNAKNVDCLVQHAKYATRPSGYLRNAKNTKSAEFYIQQHANMPNCKFANMVTCQNSEMSKDKHVPMQTCQNTIMSKRKYLKCNHTKMQINKCKHAKLLTCHNASRQCKYAQNQHANMKTCPNAK